MLGLDEYLDKIKGGWTDVDVIITMPSVMGKLGPLGRVLGPRGLMPNPKTGTVTMDVGKAVSDVKAGKIDFKVDKTGIVHAAIGKASFSADKIAGNARELIGYFGQDEAFCCKRCLHEKHLHVQYHEPQCSIRSKSSLITGS